MVLAFVALAGKTSCSPPVNFEQQQRAVLGLCECCSRHRTAILKAFTTWEAGIAHPGSASDCGVVRGCMAGRRAGLGSVNLSTHI
jgi:hypothetical protein